MANQSTTAENKILKDLGQFQITRDEVHLSELEERVLAAYDELEELRIERRLLEHSQKVPKETGLSGDELKAAITKAQREALEARASYKLRSSVIQNVLMVDPILKAVHYDGSSAKSEDDAHLELQRLLNQRDVLSLTMSNIDSSLHEVRQELAETQIKTSRAIELNRELAKQASELTERLKETDPENVEDEVLQERLARSKEDLEEAKRSRTLVKHVASGIVAASGINWAEDETLRELVLEEDV